MRHYVFFILIITATGIKADAEIPIPQLLSQMQEALQNLNYHGTMVYLHDGEMQAMRIVHKVDQDGESERLINLNGPGREVVRHNDVVTCYIPDQKVVMVGKRQMSDMMLSKLADHDFKNLQDVYAFQSGNSGRVAGLDTQRIDIIPRDKLRYGYRLWLDTDTSLLLRSDLIGEHGNVLEQTMFADIEIVDYIPPSMLTPVTDGREFNWFREGVGADAPQPVESNWQLKSLPPGFTVSGRYHHPLPESDAPAEHWVITDGLSSISIYIEEPASEADIFQGASRMGVMNVFGTLVAGHQITVIGDVPGATVSMIAAEVSLAGEELRQ